MQKLYVFKGIVGILIFHLLDILTLTNLRMLSMEIGLRHLQLMPFKEEINDAKFE